ncbi:hypothetical protein QP558_11055, partial [Escherichia coli]|nr:hypothetical protein [Escherichia coli]
KIGPDPRNFNQRVNLGRNDLLIRTFPNSRTPSPRSMINDITLLGKENYIDKLMALVRNK